MEESYKLVAEKRECAKKSGRDTRLSGRVPGVVYGKGVEPVLVSLDASDILRTYRKAGQSSLIDLNVEGKDVKVLIHDFSLHPVQNTIHHVDFLAVNMKEKTNVSVPFAFVGESPAVKTLGGIFTTDHDSVDIKCLPSDIPHEIEVDISVMKDVHDNVVVKDLKLPKGVDLLHSDDAEMLICSVVAPRVQAEDAEDNSEAVTPEVSAE